MNNPITIDKIYLNQDPKINYINKLINRHSNPTIHIPEKCKLLSSVKSYFQKYKQKVEKQTPDRSDCTSNSGVSHNGSKRASKKKRKFHDQISQIKSYIDQSATDNIILLQNYTQQPKVVLKYLCERDHTECHISQKQKQILKNWKLCLNREQILQVEKQRTWFPNPRNIELRHINAGLNQIYGQGPKRRLRPGEQAALIQSIQKFLSECSKNINQIALREVAIQQIILSWAQLEDLVNFPFCLRQFQIHFKLMATRWRYNGKHNMKNKIVQKALMTAQNRGHFLDLGKKQNLLVKYLLKYSKVVDNIFESRSRGTTINQVTSKRKGISYYNQSSDPRAITNQSQLKN